LNKNTDKVIGNWWNGEVRRGPKGSKGASAFYQTSMKRNDNGTIIVKGYDYSADGYVEFVLDDSGAGFVKTTDIAPLLLQQKDKNR
jgi:hypothetical protein